jgi:phage terminase small subunit
MALLANPRHELFCQAIASGRSAMEAYKLAGYKKSATKANATRLMENDGISSRIAELRAPLTELEEEKLKGQRLANEIAQTKLRRLHEEVLEKREVKFVTETMAVVLRQELMRLPSDVVRDLRSLHLSHEQVFSIRMSVDKTVRSALAKAAATLERALSPREAIAELVGEERQPSQKDIDAAARKKARVNAKRRVRRKVAA